MLLLLCTQKIVLRKIVDMVSLSLSLSLMGHLHGLISSALDHRSLRPGFESQVGISERCFIFDFASIPLEVAQAI